MQYDEELARMRAQMLAKEEEEPPVFDDGARFLGQDPNMMQVGLFGRPKKPAAPPTAPPVNLQRRSILGLTPMPAELPAVIPPAQPKLTPQQMEQAVKPQATFPGPHPEVWSGGPFMSMGDMGDVIKRHLEERKPITAPAAPSASPLQSLADKALNAPMSRRDVLKRAGQAALQQVVPMPSVTDVVPQVMSPLTEAAQNTFMPNPGVDEYIQDYVSNMFSDMKSSEPFAATTSMYNFVRDYLDGRVSQKELSKFDKLKDRVDRYYDNDDEYSDRATTAQESLADFIQEKLKLLKPHELYDVNENLSQEMLSPEEFYNYILETRGGQGLESLGAEGFAKYLEASEKSPKPVVPEAPKPKAKAKSKDK